MSKETPETPKAPFDVSTADASEKLYTLDSLDSRGEFLGVAHTSRGEFDVHMPMVSDVDSIGADDNSFMYRTGAAAIQVPYEEFQRWSIADALKVMRIVTKGIERL